MPAVLGMRSAGAAPAVPPAPLAGAPRPPRLQEGRWYSAGPTAGQLPCQPPPCCACWPRPAGAPDHHPAAAASLAAQNGHCLHQSQLRPRCAGGRCCCPSWPLTPGPPPRGCLEQGCWAAHTAHWASAHPAAAPPCRATFMQATFMGSRWRHGDGWSALWLIRRVWPCTHHSHQAPARPSPGQAFQLTGHLPAQVSCVLLQLPHSILVQAPG